MSWIMWCRWTFRGELSSRSLFNKLTTDLSIIVTFNEFQLRNDHIAKVGVCVPQFLCFFVLHITFYGKKKKYFCLNIVVGSCVILSFLIISSAAAFICNRKMKRRHHLSRRLFIKTRRHWRQYSGLLTKTIQVSNYD